MCTSFTYKDKRGANALARTMDFAFVLDPDAIFIPRNYVWKTQMDGLDAKTKYAFTGLGRHEEEFVFADGVNEAGLSCASLYFAGYATYDAKVSTESLNLAPHEIVFWMLANFATVDEVVEGLAEVCVNEAVLKFLGIVLPLHWIVTDRSGRTIVVEPLEDGLQIHENPLGIMSNSPDFSWHITNVRNYIGVKPYPVEPIALDGVTFAPFGQGSGTFGLPGDYTPPSRFLRVLFGKKASSQAENEEMALTSMFHLLFSVDVPKGSVETDHGTDYTQYSCVMCCDTGRYYFKTYDNNQICMVDLFSHNLDAEEPKIWAIPTTQQIKAIDG